MRAAVFGGSGFLGSHVADALTESGYEVVIFDKKVSTYMNANQRMVIGDILNVDDVKRCVSGCDVVYNFAGIADIGEASKMPLDSVKYNVLGNTTILEACRNEDVKRFVFASSLYVYSSAGSFYRSTKQACELIIENYYEVYGVPYTILRYGSLYGSRADERNAIYKFIKDAIENSKIVRHGDGEELREYIHVLDAARGSVAVLAEEFRNQHVIITGHQQVKIKELLLMIKEMFGDKIDVCYLPATDSFHYEITPYSFAPRVGKRLTLRSYLDLGQGVLECIYELYKNNEKTSTPQLVQEQELGP